MVQFTSLFIDDLCVDTTIRGKHIGQKLFEHAKKEAMRLGCYEVTLNVWEGNDSAKAFYEKMGGKLCGESSCIRGDKEYKEVGFIYNLNRKK